MSLATEIKALKTLFFSFLTNITHSIKKIFVKEEIKIWNGNVKLKDSICVFCSFAIGGIKNSTWQYLEDLKQNGFSICLISTAILKESDIVRLKELCFEIIQKENFGGDFGCYKMGILKYEDKAENLLIANDSVIGPLFPLKDIFEEMAKTECDFWSITDYISLREEMEYHVGSFFVFFKSSVLRSKAFKDFWKNYKLTTSRKKTIRMGETNLTQSLIKAGFKPKSFINSEKILKLIKKQGLFNIYKEILLETHIKEFKPFIKQYFLTENLKDIEEFILVRNKHKLQLMLIKYFKYPFIKKDILQKQFVNQFALLDFLEKNKLNISKDDILNELKKYERRNISGR
jgi:hypothetical protein